MRTAGYDVGGAHLKVALVQDGRVTVARQIACPLWLGLDRLDIALRAAADLTDQADRHVVTMTGELTEIFPSRQAGVGALVEHLRKFIGDKTLFYSGVLGFGTAEQALEQPDQVASANFLATAQLVARRRAKSMLIDMGSTTTDIIVCDSPQGFTDAERLRTGELVYTGLTRTLVPTITSRAPYDGIWQGLARDGFATMADVRRVLGELPEDVDVHATVDGRGTSLEKSLTRLARGFGRDSDIADIDAWKVSAAHIRDVQLHSIEECARQVLAQTGIEVNAVVTAGIGSYEAVKIAQRLDLSAIELSDLVDAEASCRSWVTRCAPAVAVALLCELGS